MHLVYITHSILDVHALSTGFSIAIIIGAAYGCLRLVIDLLNLVSGGDKPRPAQPPAAPPD